MEVLRDVPLAPLTTFGVGGPAKWFTRATTTNELSEALSWARKHSVASFVLGGGSNLVVSDRGLDALVIRIELRGFEIEDSAAGRPLLKIAAGEPWDEVVSRAVDAELAGVECLSGIPGLTGATPIQNVGAYGQEISDSLVRLVAIDRTTGEPRSFEADACGLSYRDSVFKKSERGRWVVTKVQLSLRRGVPAAPTYAELARAMRDRPLTLAALRSTVIELRRAKAMVAGSGGVDDKSAGSFFTNPIVPTAAADSVEERAKATGRMRADEAMPRFAASDGTVKLAAGWLIERGGFAKGTLRGSVGLSTRHALALVNRGGATGAAVVAFAKEIRDGVRAAFGVTLVPEPELVGFRSDELGDLLPRAT